MTNPPDEELNLRDYFSVVVRRKWVLLGVTAVVVLAAIGITMSQAPVYKATSQILIVTETPADPLQTNGGGGLQAIAHTLANEVKLLESEPVREAVGKAYAGPLDPATVKAKVPDESADAINLTTRAGSGAEAAKLVNTYVSTYVTYRQQQEIDDLLEAASHVQHQIDQIQQQASDASKPLADLDAQIAVGGPDVVLAPLRQRRGQLAAQVEAQVASYQTQISLFQRQLDNVQLSAGLRQAGIIQVLRTAKAPTKPDSPKPKRTAAAGLALGLVLGVLAAFALEYVDDSIKDKETLERVSGAPTLGVIPRVGGRRDPTRPESITLTAPHSNAAEAYRTLRASVKFLGLDGKRTVVQVTSPAAGEGKTVIAFNLGVALAQAGERVLLIGADLRHKRLDEISGSPDGPGLTGVLIADNGLAAAIWEHPEIPTLSIMRSGPTPPNPSDLLGAGRMESVIQAVARTFDRVIIDCPPVLPVSDALVLARYADLTLVVANERATSRRALRRTMELLRQIDAPIEGTILNGAASQDSYYGYGRGYYNYTAPVLEDPEDASDEVLA